MTDSDVAIVYGTIPLAIGRNPGGKHDEGQISFLSNLCIINEPNVNVYM